MMNLIPAPRTRAAIASNCSTVTARPKCGTGTCAPPKTPPMHLCSETRLSSGDEDEDTNRRASEGGRGRTGPTDLVAIHRIVKVGAPVVVADPVLRNVGDDGSEQSMKRLAILPVSDGVARAYCSRSPRRSGGREGCSPAT